MIISENVLSLQVKYIFNCILMHIIQVFINILIYVNIVYTLLVLRVRVCCVW